MLISIINHTSGKISDERVQEAIRGINRQIKEDFEPYWGMGATLRLEGTSLIQPDKTQLTDMRGDAVLYLWDDPDVPNALGYHARNHKGIPFGFVFTELAKRIGEIWTTTLSHEALELIADPETNLLVMGPHPKNQNAMVFHWYEMCDAVQAETYNIDGVELSNFVLPLYFTPGEEKGGRNDFLGHSYGGHTLKSFGVNPGGYVGFFDPATGKHDTHQARALDPTQERRLKLKGEAKAASRSARYEEFKK